MKVLVLMLGSPGVDKSTYIKGAGLEKFTIGQDEIRILLGGIKREDGDQNHIITNQDFNDRVESFVEECLRNRMALGQFLILDEAKHKPEHFEMPLRVAKEFGYKVMIIDCRDFTKDMALERNNKRVTYKNVPDWVIHWAYEGLYDIQFDDSVRVIHGLTLLEHAALNII